MRILECPLLKNRIALGCIGLLGLSTFSGLMHTSASSGFFQTLSQLFSKFGAGGQSTHVQESGAQGKISPAAWVAKTGAEVWTGYITPFVTTAYDWAKTKEKRDSVWGVLKKFWNYKFFKGLMSKLPWIAFSWVEILTNGELRSKIFFAWKHTLLFFNYVVTKDTFKTLSSNFAEVFAELLFIPYLAISKFSKKGEKKQSECENGARGDSVGGGETKICISVTSQQEKMEK